MSDTIDPGAVVDHRARLGDGVRIGAFSIVGPEVTLESGVHVGHHVVLEGRVVIGARTRIGHGSIVGGLPQDLKFKDGTPSGVRIGEGAVLREYVTVHRATQAGGWTAIGADCLLMVSSHVGHDCRLGSGVIVINGVAIGGHCEIDDRATLGGLAGLHPFTRVGEHAYVGGAAKVVSDVPPYMLVDGSPATARGVNVIGLRRAGIPTAERRLLQDAYRLLYRAGLSPRRAIERIRETLPASDAITRLVDFILASRRGICGPPDAGTPLEEEEGIVHDARAEGGRSGAERGYSRGDRDR